MGDKKFMEFCIAAHTNPLFQVLRLTILSWKLFLETHWKYHQGLGARQIANQPYSPVKQRHLKLWNDILECQNLHKIQKHLK